MIWGKADTEGTKIIIRKRIYCTTARKENKFRRHRVGENLRVHKS